MFNAKDVAAFLINVATTNENDLTNLKLQKVLFYAQAEHLRQQNGVPAENFLRPLLHVVGHVVNLLSTACRNKSAPGSDARTSGVPS